MLKYPTTNHPSQSKSEMKKLKRIMDEDEIISTADGEKKFELTEEGMYAKKSETFEVDIGSYVLKETEIYDENYLVLY